MRFRMGIKAGSVFLAFAVLTTSCSTSKPEASLTELIDRVCTVMKPIGYDFTESTIQALDEAVQEQLLADIAEIEENRSIAARSAASDVV